MHWLIDNAIVNAISNGLRQTHRQIADQACISPATLKRHLPTLIDQGVIMQCDLRKNGYVYKVDVKRAAELGYQ